MYQLPKEFAHCWTKEWLGKELKEWAKANNLKYFNDIAKWLNIPKNKWDRILGGNSVTEEVEHYAKLYCLTGYGDPRQVEPRKIIIPNGMIVYESRHWDEGQWKRWLDNNTVEVERINALKRSFPLKGKDEKEKVQKPVLQAPQVLTPPASPIRTPVRPETPLWSSLEFLQRFLTDFARSAAGEVAKSQTQDILGKLDQILNTLERLEQKSGTLPQDQRVVETNGTDTEQAVEAIRSVVAKLQPIMQQPREYDRDRVARVCNQELRKLANWTSVLTLATEEREQLLNQFQGGSR